VNFKKRDLVENSSSKQWTGCNGGGLRDLTGKKSFKGSGKWGQQKKDPVEPNYYGNV